ncbi:hypothetical protein KR505_11805 [Eubacterium callanderi]|uniref:hypothetical protein n=1 Tax=Eubacterium callanderi TaxID=53442 RepID=UPI001C2DB9BB|nr:hypothetical protein [Eubacterium callanderi]MBV1684085.1 hypothetical protein [Eubacterium callanderi]
MKKEIKYTVYPSYQCEYHIVFAPKYRRKAIYILEKIYGKEELLAGGCLRKF